MDKKLASIMIALTALLMLGTALVAQETDDSCEAALEAAWLLASEACLGGPPGYICNAGSAPQAEPAGPINASLSATGSLVELAFVDAVYTPALAWEAETAGIAYLRIAEPLQVTGLMLGEVIVRDVALAGFPKWQSMIVQTGSDVPTCATAPASVLVLQTPPAVTSNIVINGVSLVLNGTVAIQTRAEQTYFISMAGASRVIAVGQEQPLNPGQQIAVPHPPGNFSVPSGPPGFPVPHDTDAIANMPVGLLDRPVPLPQPGYVTTAGLVNMRAEPTTAGALVYQVPAGQVLSILGRNAAGDWYHVRTITGETGWMFADLLQGNIGEIAAIYEATPLPPGRYGDAGQTGRVLPAAGINLRAAPDVSFPVVWTLPVDTEVTILGRSPYSPWVKVTTGEVVGWAALITLETNAIFDILPIDYDVPPPPPPTRVPGSFGNAFPDPTDP